MDQAVRGLSRRERQIMDVIYARKRATVMQVRQGLADPPGYSAVRALMNILEQKGHLKHVEADGKYVYSPTRLRGHAGRGALRQLISTFFDNSAAKAMAALLDVSDADLSETELNDLAAMIEKAQKRGKKS